MIGKLSKFYHILCPAKNKIAFWGHFWLSEGYTYPKRPIVNQVLRSIWGVTNFLRPVVREIWTLGKFGAFGPNFGQKMNLAHRESFKKKGITSCVSDWQLFFCYLNFLGSSFQPDHQVSPENRNIQNSKAAAFLEFAIIGRWSPFLDWSKIITTVYSKANHNYT